MPKYAHTRYHFFVFQKWSPDCNPVGVKMAYFGIVTLRRVRDYATRALLLADYSLSLMNPFGGGFKELKSLAAAQL